MSPLLIPILALLIPIVAILSSTYLKAATARAASDAALGAATDDLQRDLAASRAETDRLRARIEALEAIVTDDGFDLARDARRAGLDLDALPDPAPEASSAARTRTR